MKEKKERNIVHLLISIALFSVVGWYINSFAPQTVLLIGLCIFIIAGAFFFLTFYIFNRFILACTFSLWILLLLTARSLGFRSLFLPPVLLFVLLFILAFIKKKGASA